MILGIFPPQGGSISSLRKAGQDARFIRSYLGNYAKHFEKVYYFSYADEDPLVPEGCRVVPNPGYHRWAYAFLLPFVQRRYVLECNVFRVMQAYGAIPALVAKLFYDKPYVVTYGYRYFEHARTKGMQLRPYLFDWRARIGAKFADRVIVTTSEMASYVEGFVPKERILLIPNGVDTALFRPRDSRPARSTKVIIHVGRLSPQKNLFMLIDAVTLIREPEVKLVLVGDGELKAELEDYAARKNISFEFMGVVSHEELPGVLNNSDVFVLSSLIEGHPKVLLEAMSCGLPCVGTDVQGTRDLIRDGETGLLCQLTAEDLADKIVKVLSNRELAYRLGRKAREFIKENFDLDALLAREIEAMALLADRQGFASMGPGL